MSSQKDDSDSFEIIGKIPKGKTYQWVAESVLGNTDVVRRQVCAMHEAGWRAVPARRHPKMPKVGKRIVHGGQVLMENSTKRVKAFQDRAIKAAWAMHRLHIVGKYLGSGAERWIALEPVCGPFPDTDGQPKIIEVPIAFKLSRNLVEAAAICALSVEEYGRRLIALILRGDLDGILVPTLERDAYEVRYLTTTER